VIDRTFEPVLAHCEQLGIPFIAYFPLATGALAGGESVLTRVAKDIGITPGQAALAWLLQRSPSIVVIPGTANPAHLRENVAARDIVLTGEEAVAALTAISERLMPGRAAEVPPHTKKQVAATAALAMDITDGQWTVKVREGGPGEPEEDIDPAVWTGVLPVATAYGSPLPAQRVTPGTPVPPSILSALGHAGGPVT
jgi:hypothetical protein